MLFKVYRDLEQHDERYYSKDENRLFSDSASVGWAKIASRNTVYGTFPIIAISRGLEVDEARGFFKAVVDEENFPILCCGFFCIEGGENMCAPEIVMIGVERIIAFGGVIF